MKPNLMQGFSVCTIIRLEIRWRTHAGYCFNTSCVLLQVAKGFVSISVKQKSIKTYKKKTNLKISLNNLEKIE